MNFNTKIVIILIFIEFLKVILINMIVILMVAEKLATPDLLKIKLF